ncbi:MAG TPA: class I SAM-dependent methyltransferase [Blastocatellia bacterium]|nr:class I SAM-dependent methyltransferase [Blastocatellia bacterium]
MTAQANQPSPLLLFETLTAYQRSEALKAAIELDLFTAIADGSKTATEIAARCNAAERGVRILCDYLTMIGFLTKQGRSYQLTQDSAVFLNRHSPAYLGTASEFLLSDHVVREFRSLTEAVRKGGTAIPDDGTLAPEHPMWERFARAMVPMMRPVSQMIAQLVDPEATGKLKVLDIASSHGMFGLAFATRNPNAEVFAVDWPNVLEIGKENARSAGVADRYHTISGSAFEVDFGTGYDVVLITNFLHHFDPPTNESLLKKVHAALSDAGRAATLEFVPNEDRISPPSSAGFSLTMLAGTPSGDAYTFVELDRMFRNAGFAKSELQSLEPAIQQLIVSQK